jgi:hypothetical protein
MLGPVFWLELRRAARRGQFQRLRLFVTLALAGEAAVFLLLCLSMAYPILARVLFGVTKPPARPEVIGAFVQQGLEWLVLEQLAGLLLVAPALAAGSISDEKETGTLQHLLSTPLLSRHLIMGKWLAQVVQVAVLGLPALPLALVLARLVGLSWADQAALLLVPLVPLPALVAGSLLASVWSRRTSSAVLAVYGVLAGAALLGWLAGAAQWLGPGGVIAACLAGDGTTWAALGWFALAWSGPVVPCLVLACWRLRPAYRKQLPGETRGVRRVLGGRRPVGRQPLRWKERYLGGWSVLPGRLSRPLALGLIVLSTALVYGGLVVTTWAGGTAPLVPAGMIVLGVGLAVLVLAALLVAVRCAASVSVERERQTWEPLLLTPLEPRHLLRGKLWGVLDTAWPYLTAYLAAALPLALPLGMAAVFWLVLTWLATWIVMYFTAATGLECSVRAGSSWRALVRALLSSAWVALQRFVLFGVPAGCGGGVLLSFLLLWTPGVMVRNEPFYYGFALGSLVATTAVLLAQAEACLEAAERRIERDERIPQGSERFRLDGRARGRASARAGS